MVESLERSRKKWLSEGIFEKYWTKPKTAKKKGLPVDDPAPNNPPKDSMTKIGNCTITIEPHVFDTIMYTVKDTTPRLPLPIPQQTMYRPIIQYGPPPVAMPFSPQMSTPHEQYPPLQQAAQISPGIHDVPNTGASNMSPKSTQPPNGYSSNHHSSIPPTPTPNPPSAQNRTPTLPPSPAPAPAPQSKTSDPVIQMLAERAATDEGLKSLMRIVADGKATGDELKRFQAHIDDLTKLLHARQAATQSIAPVSSHSPAQKPAPHPVVGVRPANQPVINVRPPYPPQPLNGHHAPPQPQALRSKGPLPPIKPDISAVVFEFVGGSGDRFLFPKYSILEYLPGGHVIASFLIVRKGSSADSKSYDPLLDYYQPVTIRLYTHQPKQLDSLAKVVAPPNEVRKYMDDIMDNMTRAEYVLLAMRLPRDHEPPKVEAPDVVMGNDSIQGQVLWNATVNSFPKPKPLKKPLTEEEQYQKFIASVS